MKVLHVGFGFRPWRGGGLIEYAEDLMDTQVAQGYEVGYFFPGRYYPLIKKPWLKKWTRRNISMYEIINSLAYLGFEQSTYPEVDLNEEYSEKTFLKVLSEFKPDIIHIQELFALPSSSIEIIQLKKIPVLMTLQDYYLLCPTIKLFDHKESLCLKPDVGDTCKICYSQERRGRQPFVGATLEYEKQKSLLMKTLIITFNEAKKLKYFLYSLLQHLSKNKELDRDNEHIKLETDSNKGQLFQQRRDTNIKRLNEVDLLVAQSFRLAEIYRLLGVKDERIRTVHLTVKHISSIEPKTMTSISHPINIATINGMTSTQKGAYLVLNALHRLKEAGLTAQFKLSIMGFLLDDIKDELLQFDNVIYKGSFNVAELNELLEGIHVGIVPSVWEEAYGYVGIEFLAKGIPVIGNRLGGIVDYTIDNVTGWVNQANTAEGLAQIITNIIHNPDQILHLNRSILSNHHAILKSINGHFEEMDKIYKELIQAKQNQISLL